MREHNRFTLVELLVVIGIIAVLASLILPAVVGAQQQGRVTQAKSDMSAITMALKGMQNTYGKMVTKKDKKYEFNDKQAKEITAGIKLGSTSGDDAYDAFIAELTVPTKISGSKLNTNKRRIVLLDPQPGFNPAEDYDSDENKTKLWRDPWGSQYCIKIRTSSSEYLVDARYADEESTDSSAKKLAGDVAIYSFGPNAKDDSGKNVEQGGDKGTDDIISWE